MVPLYHGVRKRSQRVFRT
ncbi:hypothetical protein E2C01_090831 [Portunus trituberculatus]|uniref:Uncharacterized protein n=1 Tax=Portunus trituberculatus TaxID=210409 RepID=A0A5B7JMG3_PORTR|nr:hypothetical protein [Portunus trituberculatus]